MTATAIGIQIIALFSRQLHVLFFGEMIGSPTMNFLSVFLCGGQSKVPQGLKARFFFLNFLVWSLIIRTCFQSLMYRALQMDLRHAPMKTLEELREKNFMQITPKGYDASITAEDMHNIFYE